MLRTAAVRHADHSGHVKGSLYDLCVQELDVLVALAWQDVRRVVSAHEVQPSDGLAGDLKNEVRALLAAPYADTRKQYEQWISVQRDNPRSLEPAMENAYRKIDPEIDLYVDAMLAAGTRSSGVSSIIIQGNAQVGAIVTSPGASVQVAQQNIADNRQSIQEALDRVVNAIHASSYDSQLSEVRDLIKDARTELEKDKPNSLKLYSAIAGIGTAISMLAGLKPAYESLKSVAAILGITLP